MKKTLLLTLCAAVLVVMPSTEIWAKSKSLIYKFYKEDTGKITRKSFIEIEDLPNDEKKFIRKTEGNDYTIVDEFILDKDYMTKTWSRTRSDEDTEYTGEKKGKTLYIKGKLNGEEVDKQIALDDKPFYDIPKFNLTGFVLSDKKNVQFWMLRKDKLSKMLMQAKKRGEEKLLINGKEMDVIKVYYSATGIRERYYKRNYYFRKSDGLFVKKIASKGAITDLISEK